MMNRVMAGGKGLVGRVAALRQQINRQNRKSRVDRYRRIHNFGPVSRTGGSNEEATRGRGGTEGSEGAGGAVWRNEKGIYSDKAVPANGTNK
ncbi:hypothetical protein AX774_g6786 [Zancudomyces culisetae]|uniref:Uncharacterized protein n=1 Tax=Zancudomyces culisetae TaxID=1213189 RepID=A0A1R1PFK9_ZANCU|nr:hypothetical protein AX774_g6786 [Zancudomyces culisetae]|eukprot:OMH79790.1 hypothetical protein AX774_g6786 [Zancudomyces culisetae]